MSDYPYANLNVHVLLDRLGIKYREVSGGRKLSALCPNPEHDEKSPSWFIHNIPGEPYHASHVCQGCKFKGGPNILVQTLLGLDGDEMRDWLTDITKPPPLPTRVDVEFVDRGGVRQFVLPPCFRFAPVDEWPDEHRTYVLDRVASWQVERWGLGYVTKCECEKISNGKRTVGRHRNRVVIPVLDEDGELGAYTARSILDSVKAKYCEPDVAEHARHVILGSQFWAGKRFLVTVEGPFDALAVESACSSSKLLQDVGVAALRGSSPAATTLMRLASFEGVVVMTDPDKAGEAARQAILASCGRHTRVVSLVLPPKKDPAKLVKTYVEFLYLQRRLEFAVGGMIAV